nr:uncharacterized protein LOC109157428 [Ipomoea batatas]
MGPSRSAIPRSVPTVINLIDEVPSPRISPSYRYLDPTVVRGIASKLSQAEYVSLDEWLGEEVEIIVPTPTDNMTAPPRPNIVTVHYHSVLVGLQFPLHPLVSEFLKASRTLYLLTLVISHPFRIIVWMAIGLSYAMVGPSTNDVIMIPSTFISSAPKCPSDMVLARSRFWMDSSLMEALSSYLAGDVMNLTMQAIGLHHRL